MVVRMATCEPEKGAPSARQVREYMELHAFEEMADAVDAALLSDSREPVTNNFRPTSVFPAVTPPGMAYVPYQQWGEIYQSEKGLSRGTMFPVLDLPFMPNGGDCAK